MTYSPARVLPRASEYFSSVNEPDVVVVPAGDALLGEPPRTEHVNVFATGDLGDVGFRVVRGMTGR